MRGFKINSNVTNGEDSEDELEDDLEDDDENQHPSLNNTFSPSVIEQHMKGIKASERDGDDEDGDIADAEKVTGRFILCNFAERYISHVRSIIISKILHARSYLN